MVARFRSDERAALLNALAHYAKRPGGEAGEEGAPAAAVLRAFRAADALLGEQGLSGATAFEAALTLNAFAKMRLSGAAAVRRAFEELEERAPRGPLSLVAAGLALNAAARLGQLPPPRLSEAGSQRYVAVHIFSISK